MSLPTAFFLDTSILAGQQYNFASTALASLIPVAKQRSLKLLLPDPTEREIIRQIYERSQEALKALDDARRKAPFLVNWDSFPKPAGIRASLEARSLGRNAWRAFLKEFDLKRLDYEGVELNEIMHWYHAGSPPFGLGKKRKEFPDAFAIAILNIYAHKNDCVIAVVSEDGDFKSACERFPTLLYFRSLPALTELLLADADVLEVRRIAILKDVGAIEKKLLEEANLPIFYTTIKDCDLVGSKIHKARITDVHFVAIGDRECTLTFEAEAEAEHAFSWWEWDKENEYPITRKERVVEVSPVRGTTKVTLDGTSFAIEAVTSLAIDPPFIEVTGDPRQVHRGATI